MAFAKNSCVRACAVSERGCVRSAHKRQAAACRAGGRTQRASTARFSNVSTPSGPAPPYFSARYSTTAPLSVCVRAKLSATAEGSGVAVPPLAHQHQVAVLEGRQLAERVDGLRTRAS